MRTWITVVLLAVLVVTAQAMYTQGRAQNNAGSPFNIFLQQQQYQRMYQQQQQQYNPGWFNIPPWLLFMDGFDFGFGF